MANLLIFGLLLLLAPMTLSLSRMPYVPSQEGLARLLMNAHLSGTDPERSMMCFSDYLQKSSRIGSKYSADYHLCLDNSIKAHRQLDVDVNAEKRTMLSEAAAICRRFTRCNAMDTHLKLFNCHAEIGSNNTQSTYVIAANASDFATILQESYRTIKMTEEKCRSTAERLYVEKTTANYRYLQRCLDGIENPKPPTFESTSVPSTADFSSSTPVVTTVTSTPATSSTLFDMSTSSAIIESSSTSSLGIDLASEISSVAPEDDSSIKSL